MRGTRIPLPSEIVSIIFQFDCTFREYFTVYVLPELCNELRRHFRTLHSIFPGYILHEWELMYVRENKYLQMTEMIEQGNGKWKCNGGVFTNLLSDDTGLDLHVRLTRQRIPVPIPAEILADFLYKHAFFFISISTMPNVFI